MRPIYQTFNAPNTTNLQPVILDWMQSVPNTTVGVYCAAGTGATYGVQFSMDDPNNTSNQPMRWFNDATLPPGSTLTVGNGAVTYFGYPITAVRLNLTVCAGTVEFKVIQPPNI